MDGAVGVGVCVGELVAVGATLVVVTVMLSTRKPDAASGAYGMVISTRLNGVAEANASVPIGIVSPPYVPCVVATPIDGVPVAFSYAVNWIVVGTSTC